MSPRLLITLAFPALATLLSAADNVRPVPPPGITVPDADRAELEKGVTALGKEIESLRQASPNSGGLLRESANIEIFHKAVDWALRYDEFFNPKQIETAKKLLEEGSARVAAMKNRDAGGMLNPPWNSATGLVVRAYRSEIDGSLQPYGLVVPDDWKPDEKTARPLHFWCHGRGENLSELAFIDDRMHNKGEFTPPGAIVCHLYGRFCCANKFAGETDLFEALADIKKHYAIDEKRLVIRGFSMGGASAWQFGTHFSGMWAAVAPGAGFAETAEFFHVFGPGKTPPPWWEQVLWRWYDSTTMAANLANTKTVAYSGEIDGQKQAADMMVKYAKEEGIEFPHIIGPQTPHRYHPESKPKIEEFITEAVKEGRPSLPAKVHLTTYSLIYPKVDWVEIMTMEHQWERADITAERKPNDVVEVTTKNVTMFTLNLKRANDIIINDAHLGAVSSNGLNGGLVFHKKSGKWIAGLPDFEPKKPDGSIVIKQGGLCGPIDHAFMSKFIFVEPTGHPLNDAVGAWAKGEMDHAKAFWRKVFRGDAPVKADTALTQDDMAGSNLILWGDPSSNAVIKEILPRLPIKWTADTLEFHGVKYDVAHHAPILIFPNPLRRDHYIVINSGPTFREEALLNNSDQIPKLPDWAIIDLNTPPDAKWPGLVVDAGFFDEQWKP